MFSFVTKIKAGPGVYLIYLTWIGLLFALLFSLYRMHWETALNAAGTLILTLLPFFLQKKFDLKIPGQFIVATVIFIAASIFLGEAARFYEKFWWWDVILHGTSALVFGISGFVTMLYLVQSSKITATPFLLSIFSFSFALAIGTVWEIFEFGMDQIFGLNMQRSGLMDTMTDLIIDCVGGLLAASAGYAYLRFGPKGILKNMLHEIFVLNKKHFGSKIIEVEKR